MRPFAAVAVLVAALVSSGCTAGLPVGSHCSVQFRRDVLGGGGATFTASPLTSSVDGLAVSVGGPLVRVDPHWIVLGQEGGGELWIPRGNVLLIRVSKE